jgi:eukaryotic-like serine/threonine-protein kinase
VTACPSAEVLAGFGAGTLGAAAAELERHIDVCASCRIAVSALGRGRGPAEGLGRYRMLAPLGAGAMGDVVVAHDPELDRRVAIKLMRAVEGGAEPTEQRQVRMLREARILAQLDHPNVVRVLDVGRDGAGEVWIAMELVEGGALRHWLATPRTVDAILDAFTGAARGLAAVHTAGVVHRDVKPDNLLVAGDGRIVVGDFGLALVHGGPAVAGGDPRLTASGVILGTPGYMAPEQLGGAADARCDQFAWCLALWEALFGARPFDDPDPAARLLRIARAELAPPADRPELRAVAEVLRRGLRLGPDERFPSMSALLDALANARRRRVRRWPLAAGLGVAAAIAAIGVIANVSGAPDPAPALGSGSAPDPLDSLAGPFASGFGIIFEQAARSEATRDRQIEQLDRKIAAVQRLIEAGKYDEAELRLADLHWIPVEAGTSTEAELARIIDEKRAALGRVLQRKRPN